MENTWENKTKFFAMHWMQCIVTNEVMDNIGFKTFVTHMNVGKEGYVLELKPLSLITDEDAFNIAKIHTKKNLQSDVQAYINDAKEHLNTFMPIGVLSIEMTDYLRSKGYALPFNGASVETLINYGWIKLATS